MLITIIVIILFIAYLSIIGVFSFPLIVYIKSLFFDKEKPKREIEEKVPLEIKSEIAQEEPKELPEDSTYSEEIGEENSAIIDLQDESEEEWG